MAPQTAAQRVFPPDVEAELKEHADEYVAIAEGRLVAFGSDPAAVLAEARGKTTEVPFLFRVPTDEDRAYFF